MVNMKTVLGSIATLGLMLGTPAYASATRSSESLPAVAAAQSLDVSRVSAPARRASRINPQAERLLILFGAIGAAGLLVAAAAGGGNDSPG